MSSCCCQDKKEYCFLRLCHDCKNKEVEFQDQDCSLQCHYFQWTSEKDTYVDNKTKKGKTIKRKFACTAAEMIEEFKKKIVAYLQHKGREYHRYKKITELKSNLKKNEALLHMDFSENYNLKYAEEIQALYFGGSRQQILLHTVVLYTQSDKLEKKSFCTLSECLQHNVSGIWAHLGPILKYLREYHSVDTLHFVSDSPATQYRNKTMFFFLAVEFPQLYPEIRSFSWNYSESGHGKGAPDGIGGVTKRTADRLVAQGNDIGSFDSLLQVLSENVKKITWFPVLAEEMNKIADRYEKKKNAYF